MLYVVTIKQGATEIALKYADQNRALALLPLLLGATEPPDSVTLTTEDVP